MRFSTMAILALSAHWATAARINGVIGEELEYQLTKNRELKPKGAKKASKKASKKPASCGVSGTGSKSSKKCENPTSVECGKSYAGTVTLTTGLVCPTNISLTFGIIMDGSDAVLDCAGNDVVVEAESSAVDGVFPAAIVLRNGATAMNCQVHSGEGSFGVGVWMDGDATLIDSNIYNKEYGVFITDDGCRTLTNVRTSGNGEDGVYIAGATGTIVMTNLEANGNGGSGVSVIVAEGEETTLDLVMDGAKLNSNEVDGLLVEGNVDVELFGTVRAIGNGGSGIVIFDASTLTVNGKLQASSNTDIGIQLSNDESKLAIPESGTVIACRNTEDIDGSTAQINNENGLLISGNGFGKDECASATNKAAECKLEPEES